VPEHITVDDRIADGIAGRKSKIALRFRRAFQRGGDLRWRDQRPKEAIRVPLPPVATRDSIACSAAVNQAVLAF
jgi:hypothetical protein